LSSIENFQSTSCIYLYKLVVFFTNIFEYFGYFNRKERLRDVASLLERENSVMNDYKHHLNAKINMINK